MAFLFAKPKPIADLVRADHDKVRDLYKQYQMPYTTAEQRQMLAYSIVREVTMHSAVEEAAVYPMMRRHGLAPQADHQLDEHDDLKFDLGWLSSRTVENVNYDGRMAQAMQKLFRHMREEEDNLMPRFLAAKGVTPGVLDNLSRAYELLKRVAPTRPHALLPSKPAALDLLANAALAPLDHALDMLRFAGAPPL